MGGEDEEKALEATDARMNWPDGCSLPSVTSVTVEFLDVPRQQAEQREVSEPPTKNPIRRPDTWDKWRQFIGFRYSGVKVVFMMI